MTVISVGVDEDEDEDEEGPESISGRRQKRLEDKGNAEFSRHIASQ